MADDVVVVESVTWPGPVVVLEVDGRLVVGLVVDVGLVVEVVLPDVDVLLPEVALVVAVVVGSVPARVEAVGVLAVPPAEPVVPARSVVPVRPDFVVLPWALPAFVWLLIPPRADPSSGRER